jgi:hypothetical protein
MDEEKDIRSSTAPKKASSLDSRRKSLERTEFDVWKGVGREQLAEAAQQVPASHRRGSLEQVRHI